MKACPFCAEEIQDAAIVCRHCGRDLNLEPPPPPSRQPAHESAPPSPPSRATTRVSAKLAIGVVLVGFALTLLPATWGVGYLALWLGLILLMWRRTFSAAAVVAAVLVCLIGATILQIPGGRIRDRAEEEQQRQQVAEKRRQDDERAAALFKQAQDAMSGGEWRNAARLLAQVKAVRPAFPGQAEAEQSVNAQIRLLNIDEGVDAAQKVIASPAQCQEPSAIANAWNRLKEVRATDPQWSAARAVVARLETCRRQAERELSVGMQKIMVAQREAWAQKADRLFLDQGMNMTISLSGTNKNRVTLKWALMSRAAAHQMTAGGSRAADSFLGGLQKIGFQRATFTDGYDDTWYYDLKPEDESAGGALVLTEHGLGEPLQLTQ